VERICETCKAKFFAKPCIIKRGYGKFCSKPCANNKPKRTLIEKFNEGIGPQQENGCIEWTKGKNSDGYGCLYDENRKSKRANRVSYELKNGPIPDRLDVLHSCDNPSCINPEHLFLGTTQDNMTDKMNKNRHIAPIGERNGQSIISEIDVINIRKLGR